MRCTGRSSFELKGVERNWSALCRGLAQSPELIQLWDCVGALQKLHRCFPSLSIPPSKKKGENQRIHPPNGLHSLDETPYLQDYCFRGGLMVPLSFHTTGHSLISRSRQMLSGLSTYTFGMTSQQLLVERRGGGSCTWVTPWLNAEDIWWLIVPGLTGRILP